MVISLIQQGRVIPEMSKHDRFALLAGGSHPGAMMQINTDRQGSSNALSGLMQSGYVIEGPLFRHVFVRRQMLLFTLHAGSHR